MKTLFYRFDGIVIWMPRGTTDLSLEYLDFLPDPANSAWWLRYLREELRKDAWKSLGCRVLASLPLLDWEPSHWAVYFHHIKTDRCDYCARGMEEMYNAVMEDGPEEKNLNGQQQPPGGSIEGKRLS